MILLQLCGGIVAIILLWYMYETFRIKRNWNKGVCRYTGEPWQYAGYDDEVGIHLYTTKSGQSIVFDQRM